MIEAVREIEPKLKETLYRFLEDVQSTKAALYLTNEKDEFELVTEYGFRNNAPTKYLLSDDIADRLITKRAAFFVNSLAEDSRFSELLYAADTTRMLVAPIYSRGRLVGFVDLRDKARQVPFDAEDMRKSQAIVDHFLEIFAEHQLFGQRPIAETGPKPVIQRTREAGSPLTRIVEEAKAAIGRGILRKAPPTQSGTDAQINAASLVLPAIIGLPGVVIAAVTPASRLGGTQIVAARSDVPPHTLEQFDGKVKTWLKKRGEAAPVQVRTSMVYPFGTAGPPIEPNRLVSVLSAPVRTGSVDGLVLTVAFEINPDPATKSNLEKFLGQVQQLAALGSSSDSLARMKQAVAEKLLEPDFHRYPELVTHSIRVSELAERLGHRIGLSNEECETIRLAGIVHDVGMRVLDYRNLYRKTTLNSDEQRLLRSHPIVGAALIAESPLGPEVASLVYSHHERVDGSGYPDQLSSDNIPLGSRVIHICEAYDAMTSTDSYQPPVAASAAVAKIRRAAGSQFDVELSNQFADMLAVGG